MNSSTNRHKTFTNGASALEANRLVKLASGVLAYAGAGEDSIGVLMKPVAANAAAAVKLWNDSGTFLVTAADVFAAELDVYPAANGKVSTTVNGKSVGRLCEASLAADDLIEMAKVSGGGEAATVSHIADVVTITDSSGYDATHNDTIAAMAAITTITDSTGYSGTHTDTLAATAAITTITDSTGYDGTHDDTIAATAAITTLTDNTGGSGTHDDTLAAITAPTNVTDNSTGSTADTTLAEITNSANAGSADITPTKDAIAKLAVLANAAGTAIGTIKQNQSDVAQKVIEIITREVVHAQNMSDLGQKIIELVARDLVINQNISDLGQKVIELVARDAVVAQNISDLAQKNIELVTKVNAILAALEGAGIVAAS